ncbi:MAG TPA: sugar ABC transporter permease [Candidatus Kapabacteria bacterium]|nr:sugar ABC transporter permease [Candidatus Kapabacteria bacterium]
MSTARAIKRYDLSSTGFLLPWVIVFLVFWFFPLLYSLFLSFTKYSTLQNTFTFTGLSNYSALLHDPDFGQAFANTLIFSIGTLPPILILSLLAAVLLDNVTAFRSFYRSAIFLPSVTSLVVVSLVFTNLYAHDGYIATLCKFVGAPFPTRGLLLEPSTALASVMAMDVWLSVGYYALIFLAALQALPKDVYESADLDGASMVKKFFHITLPGLRPTIAFVIVVLTIKSLQVFVEIFVMTKGGPLNRTTTLVYEVYRNAFERLDGMGYASAMAYVLFVLILLLSFFYLRLLRER